jgi:hypothetical protein
VPFDLFELGFGKTNSLVAGDHHIELSLRNASQTDFSFFFGSFKFEGIEGRQPLVELADPVAEGDFGSNDEMGARDVLEFFEEGEH